MKKIILLVFAFTLVTGTKAQKGQLDVVKELGEGTVFKEYRIWKEDDKYTGDPYDAKKTLKFTYNKLEKLTAFSMMDETTGEESINHGFGHLVPNHYTEPSVFHMEGYNFAYLYIDGLFYWLKNVSDPNNISSYKITGIYIAEGGEKKEGTETGEKKKMTMKEKIAAAKAKMASGGVPSSVTEKDHDAIIKKYLVDMKSVQEKATANFTDEIKAEISAIENADAELLAKMQADQRERSKRIGEKRAKENGSATNDYTIQNNTGGLAHFISNDGNGDGGYFSLNSGEKNSVKCDDNTYHAVQDGSGTWRKGGLITTGGNSCGKIVTVD